MIRIFDTTLRDGEQAPGFSMNIHSKIVLAKQLEKLGVDVIEAGFPIASPDDFEAVRQVGLALTEPEICGLARCNEKDIETAARALETACKPRIHVFIATSDIHLEHKLRISRKDAVVSAYKGVSLARSFTDIVEFSPEDATRSDPEFLVEILGAAIEAGASVLNIPDTVGYTTPLEYGQLIAYLHNNVRDMDKAILSTHCHNDLGLAVANSLSGVANGARQVECTINGIGERAGNASLEELVMAMKTRPDIYREETKVNSSQILASSRLLTSITGKKVQVNKAIVGENAFAHEAGIHQHGVLSNPLTYEIMKPEDVGYSRNNLVLGKHSGRAALDDRIKELGFQVDKDRLNNLFVKFKDLADKKKTIFDEDIIMLVTESEEETAFELVSARISSGKDETSQAVAKVRCGEEVTECTGEGSGPVAALYAALEKTLEVPGELKHFHVESLTPAKDAVGVVSITREDNDGGKWHGHGSDTDITIAAGKALIDLMNRKDIRQRHQCCD